MGSGFRPCEQTTYATAIECTPAGRLRLLRRYAPRNDTSTRPDNCPMEPPMDTEDVVGHGRIRGAQFFIRVYLCASVVPFLTAPRLGVRLHRPSGVRPAAHRTRAAPTARRACRLRSPGQHSAPG